MKRKLLSNTIALSLIMGLTHYQLDSGKNVKPKFERPKGYDHRIKTDDEKKNHKLHQKKIKLKRNRRKGIYETKIKYPRKRSHC